jgi:hypothetical protein
LPAGAVADFSAGLQAFLSSIFSPVFSPIATLPEVEQQDAFSLPLPAQQDDLPSTIVEHSSLPQQPFSPGLVEHFIPTAEHLQPSFVPPVSSEALALALIMFGSGVAVVEEVVLAALFAFEVFDEFVVLVLLLELPQPASVSMVAARSAASFIFIDSSPCFLKPVKFW